MNETTKTALEQRYRSLLADYRAGRIDRAAFVAAADDLHFRDAHGRYWAIGLETGEWYGHDGQTWQPGDPAGGERPADPDGEPPARTVTSPAARRLAGLVATPARSLVVAGVIFMLVLAVLALPAVGAPPGSGPAAQPSPRPPISGASTGGDGHAGGSGGNDVKGGAIVGTVTDLSSGGPAAGVLVSVSGYPPVTTDKDGRYSVSNLPAGQYTVALVLSGQGQASQGPVFVNLDGQNRVTVDMTYSSRPQQLPTDTPQAVAAAVPPPATVAAASPRQMPSSGAPAGPGPLIVAGLGLVLLLVGGALRLGSRGR